MPKKKHSIYAGHKIIWWIFIGWRHWLHSKTTKFGTPITLLLFVGVVLIIVVTLFSSCGYEFSYQHAPPVAR